jgi:hypothetical protein
MIKMRVANHGRWIGINVIMFLFLAACAPEPAAERPREEKEAPTSKVALPRMRLAPEITNESWINTDEPVTLASQRGNVVLLEFWTFG